MVEKRTVGRKIDVEITMYDVAKYDATEEDFNNGILDHYENVISWEIISGFEAKEIEIDFNMGSEERDEYGEYLRLNFEDGRSATFANSRCDMFICKYR